MNLSVDTSQRTIKISLRNVRKDFRKGDGTDLTAIANLSFDVYEGEFLCLLGPSGCGKSTCLGLLGRIDTPSGGEIRFSGQRDSYKIGFVFQSPRLLPWKTIWKNVRFSLESQKPFPRQEWNERAAKAIELVGLNGFEGCFPHQLSGGMQIRGAIARALALEPEVLLLDEPFSNLDEITAKKVRKELLSIWRRLGMTIVFITHDLHEAVFLADRILLLTPRPMSLFNEFMITVPRPRSYSEPDLFEAETQIARAFEAMMPSEE
ncbi:MAG TPA: ABC transporter ATP-binding protein [bacterium]|nr:ABC transporter ATP-binding protein [bacterium]